MGDNGDERTDDDARFYVLDRQHHDDLVDSLQPEGHHERISRMIAELRDEISQLRSRMEEHDDASTDAESRLDVLEDDAYKTAPP